MAGSPSESDAGLNNFAGDSWDGRGAASNNGAVGLKWVFAGVINYRDAANDGPGFGDAGLNNFAGGITFFFLISEDKPSHMDSIL
jgi:hypothetical protein